MEYPELEYQLFDLKGFIRVVLSLHSEKNQMPIDPYIKRKPRKIDVLINDVLIDDVLMCSSGDDY